MENDDTIANFKILKQKAQQSIQEHEREIKLLRKSLQNINEKIYELCQHVWEVEIQMYSRTEHRCKKCGLYK
jgi:peptidoglycan hydrolase CwlO-like protein